MSEFDIIKNYKEVLNNIEEAAIKSGRTSKDINLVVVSKTVSADKINELLSLGELDLGESKVQEIIEKFETIKHPCKWHIIGHLQTNKVKYIIDKVTLIHSLDSISLADELNKKALSLGIKVPVLVQVNISCEESKYGLFNHDVRDFVKMLSSYDGLSVKGLMTIAPFCENPEETRPFFKKMHELFVDIQLENIDNISMEYLSMGMSNDYTIAIEEGSNMVRVGTAIFGKRIYK